MFHDPLLRRLNALKVERRAAEKAARVAERESRKAAWEAQLVNMTEEEKAEARAGAQVTCILHRHTFTSVLSQCFVGTACGISGVWYVIA